MEEAQDLKERGNRALAAGDFGGAVRHYSAAIALDPNNHLLFSNRSAAHARAGDYGKALADAERTLELRPDWAKGYSRKAAALEFLQRFEEAKAAYEEGLRHEPGNPQLQDGLRGVEARLAERKLLNPFSAPDLLARLEGDPKTRALLGDPEFRQLLDELRTRPAALATKLQDPRVMTALSVLLGVDLSGGDEEEEAPSPPPGPGAPREQERGAAAEGAGKRRLQAPGLRGGSGALQPRPGAGPQQHDLRHQPGGRLL